MSRLFEPSYIWNYQEETQEKRGFLSKLFGLKSDEKVGKSKHFGKYEELNENFESVQEEKECGSVMKIMDLNVDKFNFNWKNGNEKTKKSEIPMLKLSKLIIETLQKCDYQLGELFVCLGKSDHDSGVFTDDDLPKITVGKLYLRLETTEMVDWWLKRISPVGLKELNISPYGMNPVELPSKMFEMPHFRVCQTLCLMEHCAFTSDQFLSICSSVPHFSFYSDTISEDVAKIALENKMNSVKGKDVIEWFFARKVDTEYVIQELVRPNTDRKERFSHQKQCFEPVDVYPVSNENNRKLSIMIVRDPSDSFKPYSLVLFP